MDLSLLQNFFYLDMYFSNGEFWEPQKEILNEKFWPLWTKIGFFSCKGFKVQSKLLKNFLSPIKINLNFSGQEFSIHSFIRLRVVPHFSSGIVERAKRERAWKSPHARKGYTRRLRFARSTIPEEKWGTTRSLFIHNSYLFFQGNQTLQASLENYFKELWTLQVLIHRSALVLNCFEIFPVSRVRIKLSCKSLSTDHT